MNQPSRSRSISNLKRSISKTSSINSLKSLLKGQFGDSTEDLAKRDSNTNVKRRRLLNDISIRNIFKKRKQNEVKTLHTDTPTQNQHIPSPQLISTPEVQSVTNSPSSSNFDMKGDNDDSMEDMQDVQQVYVAQPLQPLTNKNRRHMKYNKTIWKQNLNNLNNLDKSTSSDKNPSKINHAFRSFTDIIEEEHETSMAEAFVPPAKPNFEFKRTGIVPSKAYKDLSKLASETVGDESMDFESEPVISVNESDIFEDQNSHYVVPERSFAALGDEMKSDSYLDFFKATIEPIHSITENHIHSTSLQSIHNASRTFKKTPSVAQITRKLSVTNIDDHRSKARKFEEVDTTYKKSPIMISTSFSSMADEPRRSASVKRPAKTHQIFNTPDILERILGFVEDDVVMPLEKSPSRRKPLSIEHAKLMYGDENKAFEVWQHTINKSQSANSIVGEEFYQDSLINRSINNFQTIKRINKTLYNCLFVNKLWYSIAKKLIFRKIFFSSDANFHKLINLLKNEPQNAVVENLKSSNTNVLLLHRLQHVTQDQINLLANFTIANGNKLEWIEMYLCPNISPPISLFTPNNLMETGPIHLKKLILAGCNSKKINNFFLKIVANNCKNLEKLDLRCCDHFTDDGVIEISNKCTQLRYLNVGRFQNCDKITDSSIVSILRNCNKLNILGCAGCHITETTINYLTENYRSVSQIEKLSFNNCFKITNDSVYDLFDTKSLPNLQVFEIRNVDNIQDFSSIIEFKIWKRQRGEFFLIENCEVLEKRMMDQELKIGLTRKRNLLNDITNYCDEMNDGDMSYKEVRARLRTH